MMCTQRIMIFKWYAKLNQNMIYANLVKLFHAHIFQLKCMAECFVNYNNCAMSTCKNFIPYKKMFYYYFRQLYAYLQNN